MTTRPWHALTKGAILTYWETDGNSGLAPEEARRRQRTFGANAFTTSPPDPRWRLLLDQFRDVMVLLLAGAAVMAAVLGEMADALTIAAIIILNAAMGFMYEYRAEQALTALGMLTAPTARVLRGGLAMDIAASEVVPGDLLLLETGDRVPADGRLLEAESLEVDEAALTGESLPVNKQPTASIGPGTVLGDRVNMIFKGTAIARGRGRAVAVATGMNTEMGRIAHMIHRRGSQPTPLQRRLAELGRLLVIGCLLVCVLVVVIGLFNGEPPYTMVLAGISLAVAAIPEGLPTVVTIVLALGVHRLVKVKAVIRRLPTVETLGCVTRICSDKTGTLTLGQMRVREVWTGQGSSPLGRQADEATRKLLSIAGALCNNAQPAPRGEARGSPTEVALYLSLQDTGLDPRAVRRQQPRLAEAPFDSSRKRMSVLCRQGTTLSIYCKGAPEGLLPLCRFYGPTGGPLLPAQRRRITEAAEAMARTGLRVLAVTARPLAAADDGAIKAWTEASTASWEQELTFLGLVAMADPPREEAPAALARCQRAGIQVSMITGDHGWTAATVAEELGLRRPGDQILSGQELEQMSDRQLAAVVANTTVFARVSPEHKLRIVRALKEKGEIVAMTGDGVNDAPAVQEADVGIAMGKTGTAVTQEAAGMVLMDDNFTAIVNAIEQGRAIYENIRRFVRYLLASNLGEILVMLVGTILGLPLPLLPIHILFVNLVTDGLPAVALGLEPPEAGVMERPPRAPDESLFSGRVGRLIIHWGAVIGVVSTAVFVWTLWSTGDLARARTAALASLVVSQMFHVLDCRSAVRTNLPWWRRTNPTLWGAIASTMSLLVAAIHWPVLRIPFRTVPLSFIDWLIILGSSAAWPLLLATVRKFRCKNKAVPVG